jgi:hypothetical protein
MPSGEERMIQVACFAHSRRIDRPMGFLVYFFNPAAQFVTTVSGGADAGPTCFSPSQESSRCAKTPGNAVRRRWPGAERVAMCFGINLKRVVSCVFSGSPMNTSAPCRPREMKLNYRVKAPLSARTKIDAPTSFWIPRGSLIQWLPRASHGLGFTSVRWLQDNYIVSDAELNQNCERILDLG